jgi:acyl-homoserine-lactone acylase
MKRLFVISLFVAFSIVMQAQKPWPKYSTVNPKNVQIARDKWGVPHVFAKTDEEVAYGLAWATAEDDFSDMQFMLMAAKNCMGRHMGKDGAAIDYVGQLLRIDDTVNRDYDSTFSPEFKKVINGYVDGINAYAQKHPNEVFVKDEFPLTPKQMIAAYTMGMVAMSGVDGTIKDMLSGNVAPPDSMVIDDLGQKGSNGLAFSGRVTTDGKTYLDINSHQPLEGPLSWYEAHVCSDEGWNMIGGTFPGGMAIFHGVNENLGWAHTVNGFDNVDVYQLEMHPKKKYMYKFDGKWEKLDVKKAKLKVKLNKWLTVGVGKKIFWSKYGATVEAKTGKFYSIRFPAYLQIGAIEQWFRMNKAKNFTEFKDILNRQQLNMMNIVYADREDNIYYLFNGLIPKRDSSFNWHGTLPGNTSKTLWTEYRPIEELPQVENPDCGYIYNCNNTPFNSSCEESDPKPEDFPKSDGIQTDETNRSNRFRSLVAKQSTFSWEDFLRIKYDVQLPDSIVFKINLAPLFKEIDPIMYPDLTEAFTKIRSWNHRGDADNMDAALVLLTVINMNERAGTQKLLRKGARASESFYIDCLRDAKDHLVKFFGDINIKLGDLLRHSKGDIDLPVSGFPDALAAAYPKEYKDGKFKVWVGDSYIMLVKFAKEGLPEIQTVNCYGASNHPDSPHFTDQMQLFADKKTKPMTLDKAAVLKDAVRVYSPE